MKRIALSESHIQTLLSGKSVSVRLTMSGNYVQIDHRSVEERLADAREELAQAIKEANDAIKHNPATPFFRKWLQKKTGYPVSNIYVDDKGEIVSRSGDYESHYIPVRNEQPVEEPVTESKDLRKLPMADLRKRAEDLRVNIDRFGRKKAEIVEYLTQVEQNPAMRMQRFGTPMEAHHEYE